MSKTCIHPAHSIPFGELIDGLEAEIEKGYVNKRFHGPLTQYTYTQSCTYDGAWNLFTMSARGIIVDHERIVATPFPKFFNLTENKVEIPDLPFHSYEKVDGSLIITYFYDGEWQTATKGSFNSDQAKWAKEFLNKNKPLHMFDSWNTYLFEAVYPENRIVVNYGKEDLVLLGAYTYDGLELDFHSMVRYLARKAELTMAKTYSFQKLEHIITLCENLPSNEEGYVIRFEDGTRVKIKGSEYCRLHRMISNITPLAIWELMLHHDDLEFARKEIPEEFLADFDSIVHLIQQEVNRTSFRVSMQAILFKNLSDKEVGLQLHTLDPDVRKLIFPFRKNGTLHEGKPRETLYRMHRPTGNYLQGYVPSSSMNRIQDDE
jgi:RNA ligase